MSYNPGVSFFIPFHKLDPSNQQQCIYFTQKGARCQRRCRENDNKQAVALQKTIISMPCAVSLDLLKDYVLYNCCRGGNVQHQDRIEDVGLLISLALRWQDEIRRHATEQSSHIPPVPALEESVFNEYACTTPATSTPSHNRPRYNSAAPSEPAVSPSSYQDNSRRSSTASQPHYDFRSRQADSFPKPPIPQALSEFRPHKKDPGPKDSVYKKILDPLKGRDFEKGSLYIFDRISSPGHVKIGWTAKCVSRRLKDWSKCGYNPKLLFRTSYIPHAQRVETLTHYELIKEWRHERMCEGCGKSHREWFKTSKEQAEQVLRGWADFIEKAEPYDQKGSLKNRWKEVVETIERNGEVVVAKTLLDHYEASLVEEVTVVEEQGDLEDAPKIVEVNPGDGRDSRRLKASKEGFECVDSLQIEQPTLPKETALLKREPSPKQIPLMEIPLPNTLRRSKSDSLLKGKPLSRSKPVREGVLAPEIKPVKEELLHEQIPPPTSPLPQPTKYPQKAISLISPSAKSSEGILQTNMQANTDITDTNSPPLNLSHPSPRPKFELVFNHLASSESESEFLGYDRQAHEEIKSHGQDENTTTETEPGPGVDGWDTDETLVEDQITGSLEKAALNIIDGVYNETTGEVNGALKGLDGLKILESETQPAIETVLRT